VSGALRLTLPIAAVAILTAARLELCEDAAQLHARSRGSSIWYGANIEGAR
jgi:hypothetical protein